MKMVNRREEIIFSDNYTTSNPVIKKLQNNFFAKLFSIVEKNKIRPESLLELGAGEGYSTRLLKKYFGPDVFYISSDLRTELVKANYLNSKCDSQIVFDIKSPPVRYKMADLVIALEVLEHIPGPEAALEQIALLTNGSAILSVPFEPWWRLGNILRGAYLKDFGNTPDHVNHWNRQSFKRFLKSNFANVDVTISFPWLIAICSH